MSALIRSVFDDYAAAPGCVPLFLCGRAEDVLPELPERSVDCVMTSPPYWGQRDYGAGGIGSEARWVEYVDALVAVFGAVRRVLKPSGSLWLNLGDAYLNKGLLGLPWRVAFALTDRQGWVLRNDVVWNKMKGGMDSSVDRLRNVHEYVFHLVLAAGGYFYDGAAARRSPGRATVTAARVVSATGVSGVRYRAQVRAARFLSAAEKAAAEAALDAVLAAVRAGDLSDFRMIIRGVQRVTHSDSERLSGRARELKEKGYYFLKYHPSGPKIGDVWDVPPEDTHGRAGHFAPYPEALCLLPIAATCPAHGIVLDPFAGTGSTGAAAAALGRKSVGVEVSPVHVRRARDRCGSVERG